MSEFVDAILSFPTVIFTVALAVSLSFFAITTLLGAGMDADFDFDADIDGDLGASLLSSIGLAGVPIAVSATLISLFAWFASVVMTELLDDGGDGIVAVYAVIVIVLALIVGVVAAGVIGRPVGRAFNATQNRRRGDLLGRACTITTLKVTDSFGQAEVPDPDGGTLLVQVRSLKPTTLTAGDPALIFERDSDSDAYYVTPQDPELTA